MFTDRNQLKKNLIEIKNNDYKIPSNTNTMELALDMMENIGDPDPELRDDLIYSCFFKWITGAVFSARQLKQLLDITLDMEHMFYRIGEEENDSVLTRSFSALLVALIIYYHRNNNFLSREDITVVKEKTVNYMLSEKDVRGYISEKGWAHSAAHTADALDELSQCTDLTGKDLMDILQAIKVKVNNNSYAYVNEEDERMSVGVVSIVNRHILSDAEMSEWFKSFENLEKINRYPEDQILRVNVKSFLRSVYFRLVYENGSEVIIDSIRETLFRIKKF